MVFVILGVGPRGGWRRGDQWCALREIFNAKLELVLLGLLHNSGGWGFLWI
jgi:hypothetical protein